MAKGGRYYRAKVREECVMQTAKTYLELIGERGKKDIPLERVYRQLFNRELYLMAYGKIYRNTGAMTPGTTEETADGMTLGKIDTIIALLRNETYRWTPVRRVYIEKKSSKKKRPLGLPTWSDKLLQEVIRLILENYFEPQFSPHSHGFRPERGCHTALRDIYHTWTGTNWFIEGDIKACFDTLDHEVLMSILAEKIHDGRFLRLIKELLRAGYLENWKYNATYSGSPQGGIVSPILANIYLNKLDTYVQEKLLPEYTRGKGKKDNPRYKALDYQARLLKSKGRGAEAWEVKKEMRKLPSLDTNDPAYRRLNYVRYADDFMLGFLGPKAEAEAIKQKLGEFIRTEMKLELSEAKTLITHARTEKAKFLGYEIFTHHNNNAREPKGKSTYKARRRINGVIALNVPAGVIREKCQKYMQNGKPIHRKERETATLFSIVTGYQAEYRGIVEYYRLAHNLSRFTMLRWVMETSLTKTLASKLKISVSNVYRKYQTTIQNEDGAFKGLQILVPREGKKPLIAQWGGITLKRKMSANTKDVERIVWNSRSELEQRLLADTCEQCGSHDRVQVHHIRALKDLQQYGQREKPAWVKLMAARHRKTLVVCHKCHWDIHGGRLMQQTPTM